MGCMCGKCKKMSGWVLLIFGIIFLLKDLGVWTFWDINWWSVALILLGCMKLGCCNCKECQECNMPEKKKRK